MTSAPVLAPALVPALAPAAPSWARASVGFFGSTTLLIALLLTLAA